MRVDISTVVAMCRIAYFSNKAIERLTVKQLAEFLDRLEISGGGDGNGVGGITKDHEFVVHKGVYVTNHEIAEIMKSTEWVNGCIYHTRAASSGVVNDFLCHPFIAMNKNCLLAHNGHVTTAYTLLKLLKALYPDRYGDYEYNAHTVYTTPHQLNANINVNAEIRVDHDVTIVSDSWIAAQWLDVLIEIFSDEEEAIKRFANYFADYGNYFIQTKSGAVYCVIGYADFEIYFESDFVVCASEGVREVLKLKPVYTMTHGIIKVPSRSQCQVLRGRLTRKRRKVLKNILRKILNKHNRKRYNEHYIDDHYYGYYHNYYCCTWWDDEVEDR